MSACLLPLTNARLYIAGATGGVGSRVVGALLRKGYNVRAVVRDVAKARKILVGGSACE